MFRFLKSRFTGAAWVRRSANMHRMIPLLLLTGLLAVSCGEAGGGHDEEQEDHAESHEEETSQLLLFSGETEWFIEYTPMISGETSEWLIHLTRLSDGRPADAKKVTLRMRTADGTANDIAAATERPGLFHAAVDVPATSDLRILLYYHNGDRADSVTASITVFASDEEHHHAEAPAHDEGILFTKEQAWSIDFRVEPVRVMRFPTVIKTTGHLLPHPDLSVELPANASGVLSYHTFPIVPGQQVRKGDVLARITGAAMTTDNLEARIADAKAVQEKAKADYARAELLFKENALSEKALQEQRLRYEQAQNALRTLSSDMEADGKNLRASRAGYIKDIRVANGAYVHEGDPVLTIARNDRILLKAEIYQDEFRLLPSIHGASFRTSDGQVYDFEDLGGKLRSRGMAVDASAYSVPIYFEINGEGFIPGEFVDVFLHAGEELPRLMIPVSALVEDLGKFYVYVQTGGERFVKREITAGTGDGVVVPVLAGLEENERIVTHGAHAVRLAASAGRVQAHAHEH